MATTFDGVQSLNAHHMSCTHDSVEGGNLLLSWTRRCPEMLLHGEAVAIDMALSTELAFGRGLLSPQQRLRVLQVMRDLQLPLWHECCSLDLLMKVRVCCVRLSY